MEIDREALQEKEREKVMSPLKSGMMECRKNGMIGNEISNEFSSTNTQTNSNFQ